MKKYKITAELTKAEHDQFLVIKGVLMARNNSEAVAKMIRKIKTSVKIRVEKV